MNPDNEVVTHFQIPKFYLYRNRKVQSLEFFREPKTFK